MTDRVCPVCGEPIGEAMQGTCSRCGTYVVVNQETGQPVAVERRGDATLTPRLLIGLAAAVVIVAAFLPWVSAGFISINGWAGDGKLTAIAGALGAGLALVITYSRTALYILEIIISAFVLFVMAFHVTDPGVAIGSVLTMIAGVFWFGTSIWALTGHR